MNGCRIRWVISGGIGSGKTAVREILADYGFETIDADELGHQVIEPDGPGFSQVAERWPQTVVEGRIDRASLAQIVFADENELRELEAITHPHIFGSIRGAVEGIEGPIAVEIPVLDHGLGSSWRRLIVDSDDRIRFERLVNRGTGLPDARARMSIQPGREHWLAVADAVVPNHHGLDELTGALRRFADQI